MKSDVEGGGLMRVCSNNGFSLHTIVGMGCLAPFQDILKDQKKNKNGTLA